MHQLIPPAHPSRGQPRGICSGSLSLGWGICAPRGRPLGIWYTRFQNRQKPGPSRCVLCCFVMEAFVGKDMDFKLQWLVREGLYKLAEIFRGEFSNFRKFSDQCFIETTSWDIYLSIEEEETYAANKKIGIQRTQSGLYNASFCEFKWLISIKYAAYWRKESLSKCHDSPKRIWGWAIEDAAYDYRKPYGIQQKRKHI